MFKISDKVVCVDDNFTGHAEKTGNGLPVKGVVYVIRGMEKCPVKKDFCFYLVGITSQIHPTFKKEFGFNSWRFRKLEEVQAENKQKKANKQPVNLCQGNKFL